MRMIWLTAVAVALVAISPKASHAVTGAHFAAWDRYERAQKAPQARHGRKAARKAARGKRAYARAVPRQPRIHPQLSPPIARTPLAAVANLAPRILPHPPGCPRRLFCGCGAAIEVFGKPIRHLWLAANWLKFPPAQPGPGMVAARRGHVMVIRRYLGNGKALVYNANGGGGKTWLHVRSLAGFSIRNPRA